MSTDTVFRIALGVFFGILLVLQLYFGYRVQKSRKPSESGTPAEEVPSLSRQASFRYGIFLTAFYIFTIIWAGYGIRSGRLSWFLGIASSSRQSSSLASRLRRPGNLVLWLSRSPSDCLHLLLQPIR